MLFYQFYLTLFLLTIFKCLNCEVGLHTNEFAVHLHGGNEIASEIAKKYGFVNRGQIGSLKDYYLFEHHEVEKRSIS
ncbi:Furin-like protease 2, partial [Stegodyphus mimosarum]